LEMLIQIFAPKLCLLVGVIEDANALRMEAVSEFLRMSAILPREGQGKIYSNSDSGGLISTVFPWSA
jgi:hypothetical protein